MGSERVRFGVVMSFKLSDSQGPCYVVLGADGKVHAGVDSVYYAPALYDALEQAEAVSEKWKARDYKVAIVRTTKEDDPTILELIGAVEGRNVCR